MDYPTAEEEYELLYGEELEMMENFDGKQTSSINLGARRKFSQKYIFRAPKRRCQSPPISLNPKAISGY